MVRFAAIVASVLAGIGLATAVFAGCDNPPAGDGSFWHCDWAMGFSDCYQACIDADGRPVPTDMDYNTRC